MPQNQFEDDSTMAGATLLRRLQAMPATPPQPTPDPNRARALQLAAMLKAQGR